jgi:hypothetical protein
MTVSVPARNCERSPLQGCHSRVRFERFQSIAAPFPSQSNGQMIHSHIVTLYFVIDDKQPLGQVHTEPPSVKAEAHAAQGRPCDPCGRPSFAAIVAATSARLERAPIGPAAAPAPKARIGTCSRV